MALLPLKLLVCCTVAFCLLVNTNGLDKYASYTQLAADQACRGARVMFSTTPVPAVKPVDVCQSSRFASGSATPFLTNQVCDYRVLVYLANRYTAPCPVCAPNSKKWLVAIHGGKIDKGTSPLTALLASCTCANAYIFEDCPRGGHAVPTGAGCYTSTNLFNTLHITQTGFDESYLRTTVKAPGNWVVWLHNYYEPNYSLWASTAAGRTSYICVSGSDPYFAAKLNAMKLAVEGKLQQALLQSGFNQPIKLIDARNMPAGTASPCIGIFRGGNAITMNIEFPRALNTAIAADIRTGGPNLSTGILCNMMRIAVNDRSPTSAAVAGVAGDVPEEMSMLGGDDLSLNATEAVSPPALSPAAEDAMAAQAPLEAGDPSLDSVPTAAVLLG